MISPKWCRCVIKSDIKGQCIRALPELKVNKFRNQIILSYHTAKCIRDRSIFFSVNPKYDIWLFVDLWGFTCFYQFLHMVALKIVLHNKCQNKNNFVSIFLQIILNLGKSSEVNKQYHVKLWKTYRNINSVW